MEYPIGIEGDYIETKEESLIFDVKGLLHPKDRKICFLRFYPDPKGDRKRGNISYKKIYDLNERFEFLRKNHPKYLFFSKKFDMELQSVKLKDIKKIYTPREFLFLIKKQENVSGIKKLSLELCEIFIKEGGIPESNIGISGSSMVNLERKDSDIDLIIYGTNTSLKFQNKLKELFASIPNLRKYNSKELKDHYHSRFGGSNIEYKAYLFSEKRKLHQGKFKNVDFFLRYIKSPSDWKGKYEDYSFKNLGRVKLIALIENSKDSIFTPCSYKIKVEQVLRKHIYQKEINLNEISEVNSYRGRFCEQAVEGERVVIEGKLERVIFKGSSFYRILLTDQVNDKMFVLKK
ncbi:MAG: hypothetical protein ACTSUX_12900 [Promethearchaeota archaeon]